MSAELAIAPLADGPGLRLDCLGLLCPVPIIKAGRAIRRVARGEVLELVADDPGVERDVVDWCSANRHALLSLERRGDVITTRIRREW